MTYPKPRTEVVMQLVDAMLDGAKAVPDFTGDELLSAVMTLVGRICRVTLGLTLCEEMARQSIGLTLGRFLMEFGPQHETKQ